MEDRKLVCKPDYEAAKSKGNLLSGAFDSAKNHKRQRRKRQSVTAKRQSSYRLG